MSETDHAQRDDEVEHPELDRAYERDEGGQVPEEQSSTEYTGPDPTEDRPGDGGDEDQGT